MPNRYNIDTAISKVRDSILEVDSIWHILNHLSIDYKGLYPITNSIQDIHTDLIRTLLYLQEIEQYG